MKLQLSLTVLLAWLSVVSAKQDFEAQQAQAATRDDAPPEELKNDPERVVDETLQPPKTVEREQETVEDSVVEDAPVDSEAPLVEEAQSDAQQNNVQLEGSEEVRSSVEQELVPESAEMAAQPEPTEETPADLPLQENDSEDAHVPTTQLEKISEDDAADVLLEDERSHEPSEPTSTTESVGAATEATAPAEYEAPRTPVDREGETSMIDFDEEDTSSSSGEDVVSDKAESTQKMSANDASTENESEKPAGQPDSIKNSIPDNETPKDGSLASFFEKVNSNAAEPQADLFAAANDFQAQVNAQTAKLSPKKTDQNEIKPYCGVWGKYESGSRPRVNLKTLFLIFEDLISHEVREIIDLDKTAEKLVQQAEEAGTAVPPREPSGANDNFVEGLDDIDKLFESIEPPDELDVGAAGSSIQEVIVGQGSRIVIKQIKLGADFTRKAAMKLKEDVVARWQASGIDLGKISKEYVLHALRTVWNGCQTVFDFVRYKLDELFGGEDIEIDNEDFEFTPPGEMPNV